MKKRTIILVIILISIFWRCNAPICSGYRILEIMNYDYELYEKNIISYGNFTLKPLLKNDSVKYSKFFFALDPEFTTIYETDCPEDDSINNYIKTISIVSNSDYNSQYLAGSDLLTLFVSTTNQDTISYKEYFEKHPKEIHLILKLKDEPEFESYHEFTIKMVLSDNININFTTAPIKIKK